ncbi:rRNA processing protein [Malassezia pachydermatis]
MLMRRFLFASFRLLLLNNCEDVLIKRFVQIMRGTDGPLSSNNVQVPDSLTYHVCDIYLDELERAASQLDPVPAIPVLDLLTPFMDLAATSRSKRIYERVMTSVLTPFLDACAARIPSSEQPRKRRKVHQDAATDVDLAYPHVLAHSTLETPAHGAHATDRLTPATSEDPAALYRTLKQEALRRIVAAASSPDTYVPSRRKLYALWSESQETEDDE